MNRAVEHGKIAKDLRDRKALNDAKLAVMTRFACHLNAQRGWVEPAPRDAFLDVQRQLSSFTFDINEPSTIA